MSLRFFFYRIGALTSYLFLNEDFKESSYEMWVNK